MGKESKSKKEKHACRGSSASSSSGSGAVSSAKKKKKKSKKKDKRKHDRKKHHRKDDEGRPDDKEEKKVEHRGGEEDRRRDERRKSSSKSAVEEPSGVGPASATGELASLKDLLQRCQKAREERWTDKYSLATIRKLLGLPRQYEYLTSKREAHLKSLYVEFLKDLQECAADDVGPPSRYLAPLFESTTDEPDGAVAMLQFLHCAGTIAPSDPDMARVADMIAKDILIGEWCREVLRYPNDFHDQIHECAIAHLQEMFFIISLEERLEFVLTCILRGSDDPVEGLNELRLDLINVVSREGGASCMTTTRALYFHNSIEVLLFGKNEENPMLDEQVDVFENSLESVRDQFPSEKYFQTALDQLSPCCSAPVCFRRGPVACCDMASYCSQQCRDRDWKVHRSHCRHGKNNKVPIEFPEPLQRPASMTVATPTTPDSSAATDHHESSGVDTDSTPIRQNVGRSEAPSSGGTYDDEFHSQSSDDSSREGGAQATKEPLLSQDKKFDSSFTELDQRMQPGAAAAVKRSNGDFGRKTPMIGGRQPSTALTIQNDLLNGNNDIDYFVVQPWGNIGLQLKAPNDKEFRKLRTLASNSSRKVQLASVQTMFQMLLERCPYLENSLRAQLQEEYGVALVEANQDGGSDTPEKKSGKPRKSRSSPDWSPFAV